MNDAGASRPEAAALRSLSTFRVTYWLARLSWYRLANRVAALRSRRATPGARGATERKAAPGRWMLAFLGILLGFQAVQASARLVHRVARDAEARDHSDQQILEAHIFRQLESAPPERLEEAFEHIVDWQTFGTEDEARRAEQQRALWHTFRQHGRSGFRPSELPRHAFWPSRELWYSGGGPLEMLQPLAWIALLLGVAQILAHVAGPDDDLAKVGAQLEWLFTFPVPPRALFLARAVSALSSGMLWVLVFPFYVVVFWCSGRTWAAVPLGAGAALYVGLLGGGLRVLLETTLRRHLSASWVSRIQAALLTSSVLALLGTVVVVYSPQREGFFEWARSLPEPALLLPVSLPIWVSLEAGALLAGAALVAGWLWFSVATAERMVRGGVTTGAGPYVAPRGLARGAVGGTARRSFAGVAYKELCALFRDRRLRAQAVITPLLTCGMQLWLIPGLLQNITSSPRHAAAAAFGVASFTLATGASGALATEGSALWMMYTLPHPLERLLLRKLWVWLGLAYLFGAGVLALAWIREPALLVPSLPYVALAAVGVYLYGVIALGVGSLGTDPLEAEPRRRVRSGSIYLFLLLASLFAYAIYVESSWAKFVQLVLSALLAFALWQKLRDHLPYLLDPTEAPAPQIGVADGVIAALGFFVLQGVFGLLFGNAEALGKSLLLAFSAAGLSVTLLALFIFRSIGVPRLLQNLGLTRRAGARSRSSQIALGVVAGMAAGAVALGYRALSRRVQWLGDLFENAESLLPDQASTEAPFWFVALALLAAPCFEEFIFRGILYRGLRRSLPARVAVLASALVFALVHPAVAAPPVFVMALLAALAYERTGWLATPVSAHVTYNAIVLTGLWWTP